MKTAETTNPKSLEEYISEALPYFAAQSNLSTEGFLGCVRLLFEEFPADVSPSEVACILPSPREFHLSERRIADMIWDDIRRSIDGAKFFGLTVDGGVDKVLNEHVLIAILYVVDRNFLLPPIYHPKHKSFNGVEMAQSLMEVLRSCLSDARLSKLRYIMADGAPVNNVVRREIESSMANIHHSLVSAEEEIYSRIRPIGSTDRENIILGVHKQNPHVALLPCFGHLFHNIAKDAMQHYADEPIMNVRTYLSRIFYGGDRVGAKKGKYFGRALEDIISTFDEETQNAESYFKSFYRSVDSEKLDKQGRKDTIIRMKEALQTLTKVSLKAGDVLNELEQATSLEDQCEVMRTKVSSVVKSITHSHEVRAVTSPKLGGVTRWISDKFESIKFLSEQMPTVASFIKSELEGLRAPQSVHDLAEIFAKHPLNDLIGTGTPIFDFTREEWDAYTTCQDYEWTCGMSDVQWWHEIGSKRFSTIYEAALHYLWLPPLVTACTLIAH